MKKCIVQYWIPSSQYSDPEYNNLLQEKDQYSLAEISKTSFQTYAEKYKHDFIMKNVENRKHTQETQQNKFDDELRSSVEASPAPIVIQPYGCTAVQLYYRGPRMLYPGSRLLMER